MKAEPVCMHTSIIPLIIVLTGTSSGLVGHPCLVPNHALFWTSSKPGTDVG